MEQFYLEMQNNFLLTAVKNGTLKQVTEIFESGSVQKDDKWFDYVLLTAALHREHKAITHFLLKNECRVRRDDAVDNSEFTPLHYAVKLGDAGIVRKILNKGASFLDSNYNENSLLYLAVEKNKFEIVDLILCKYNFEEVDPASHHDLAYFQMACLTNNLDIMRKFVERGVSVNSCSIWDIEEWRGFSPLHFAVQYNCRFQVLDNYLQLNFF